MIPVKFTTSLKFFLLTLLSATAIFTLAKCEQQSADSTDKDKVYYAIEMNNVLCGYTEASQQKVVKDGQNIIEQKLNVFIMLSLLGSDFNSEMKMKSYLDPETKKCIYTKGDIKQGTVNREFEINFKDDKATITSSLSSQSKELVLTPDVLSGNDEVFTKLKEDMLNKNIERKSLN